MILFRRTITQERWEILLIQPFQWRLVAPSPLSAGDRKVCGHRLLARVYLSCFPAPFRSSSTQSQDDLSHAESQVVWSTFEFS